jgi:membrane fusion protein, macrolide-specific efflux system
MNDGTGSRRGRRSRPGGLTGIDTLLSARGDDDPPAMAGPAAHQKAPRRRNPLPRARRLLSRPRIALPAVVIVVAAASLGAWAATRSTGPAGPAYHLFPATMTTIRQALSTSGTIQPATTDTLSFSAAGQVTAVDVQVGQRVTTGQTLATMDSPSLKAQAAQAQASLAGAQSQLSQDQASSASSAQMAADQASVSAAQSQADSANAALSGAALTSPIDGIVVTVGLTAGQQMSGGGGSGGSGSGGSGSGGDSGSGGGGSGGGDSGGGSGGTGSGSSGSITVISANDILNANVNATVVGRIKAGDQAVITTANAAGPVLGTVASIGLVASVSSGVATFPVVVDVTGTPSGLYEGASATISIIYHQVTDVLAVPAAAISMSGGKNVVHTMVHGHRVAKDVTIGLTSGGLTQITSGLTAGEQVVVPIPRAVSGSGSAGNSQNSGVIIGPRGRVIQIGGGGFGPKGG